MRKLKLKYNIEFLGVYDYYGQSKSQDRYVNWIIENCKGRWNYYSPDAKKPLYVGKKPDDWPIFYTIVFYFSHKKDYEKFKTRFI